MRTYHRREIACGVGIGIVQIAHVPQKRDCHPYLDNCCQPAKERPISIPSDQSIKKRLCSTLKVYGDGWRRGGEEEEEERGNKNSESIKVDEVYAKKCAGGNYQQMSVIRNSATPPTCAMCVQCLYVAYHFFKYCCLCIRILIFSSLLIFAVKKKEKERLKT